MTTDVALRLMSEALAMDPAGRTRRLRFSKCQVSGAPTLIARGRERGKEWWTPIGIVLRTVPGGQLCWKIYELRWRCYVPDINLGNVISWLQQNNFGCLLSELDMRSESL